MKSLMAVRTQRPLTANQTSPSVLGLNIHCQAHTGVNHRKFVHLSAEKLSLRIPESSFHEDVEEFPWHAPLLYSEDEK